MTNVYLFLANQLIFIEAVILAIFLLGQNKKIIFRSLLAILVAYYLGYLFKHIYYLPRPYLILNSSPLGSRLSDGSFPSGHAILAFSMGLTILWRNRNRGLVLLALAILVGLGRILIGVHTIFDVLGGIIIAIVTTKVVDNYHSE